MRVPRHVEREPDLIEVGPAPLRSGHRAVPEIGHVTRTVSDNDVKRLLEPVVVDRRKRLLWERAQLDRVRERLEGTELRERPHEAGRVGNRVGTGADALQRAGHRLDRRRISAKVPLRETLDQRIGLPPVRFEEH